MPSFKTCPCLSDFQINNFMHVLHENMKQILTISEYLPISVPNWRVQALPISCFGLAWKSDIRMIRLY